MMRMTDAAVTAVAELDRLGNVYSGTVSHSLNAATLSAVKSRSLFSLMDLKG